MNGRLVPRAALTPGMRDDMFALLADQFIAVRREVFETDLAGKNWVLLLEDEASGSLRGFTTLLHYRACPGGRPVQVVFSGDTVIAASSMGSSSLARCWLGAVNHLREGDPAPLYWLLIVSGYRTYRFMPVFWREFYPRFDSAMPPAWRTLVDQLAADRFGSRYDPATGIVRLEHPQLLREDLRGIPAARLQDPHIAFFARANPGHARGDELVCITEFSPDNLTPVGHRTWAAGQRAFAANGRAS